MSNRTPVLYPWYRAAIDAHCWLPVFILYFSSMLTLQEVLILEAVYYVSIVLLEVPSGMMADRCGRKRTLIYATVSLIAAYGVFFVATDLSHLIVAQIFLAMGLACKSGADTALHYDSLEELQLTEEYEEREARVARLSLSSGALAALFGGVFALWDLRFAYLASGLTAIVALVCLLPMKESEQQSTTVSIRAQLSDSIKELRKGTLAWLFAFSVLMCVLMHIPYLMVQPLMEGLFQEFSLNQWTPLATGAQAALSMGLAAIAAAYSAELSARLGTLRTLLMILALQILVLGLLSISMHPIIAVVIVLRVIPKGLMSAPLNAAITPLIRRDLRATFLSLQSLIGRLAYSAYLLAMSLWVSGSADWQSLQFMLLIGVVAGVIGLTFLLVVVPGSLLKGASGYAGKSETVATR